MSHCWGSSACAISQECYGSERRSYRGSYFCLPSSLRPKGRRKAPPETIHPPNTPSFSVSPLPADRHVVTLHWFPVRTREEQSEENAAKLCKRLGRALFYLR